MKGALLPLVALGVCCAGHLALPLVLALGPAAVVAFLPGALGGAVAVVLAAALGAALAAVWLGRRRRACAPPISPFPNTR